MTTQGFLNAFGLGLVLCLATPMGDVFAQTTAAEIIEKARERARQVDEIKQVLNDPDQNVRLAAFEAMVGSDDPLMRELALDAGLSSTDQVLRGMALKHAVLNLAAIHVTLAVDESAPKPVQERVQAYLQKSGRTYQVEIDPKSVNPERGSFYGRGNPSHSGNVSGTVVTFSYGYYTGELHLQDDNTLAGHVHYSYGGDHQFKATAPIR